MLRITGLIKKTLKDFPEKISPSVPDAKILIWNITGKCNLACQHCYNRSGKFNENGLPKGTLLKVIPSLKELGIKSVILSGGEPLLRSDVFDIAYALKKENIMTSLSSNGTLINESNIEEIKENFDYVGISLDGDEETHDKFRGAAGSFKKAANAVNLCMENDVKAGLRFSLTKFNFDKLDYFIDLALKFKVPKIYISHLVYSGRGASYDDLSTGRYAEISRKIINTAIKLIEEGKKLDVVTGNSEEEAVVLLDIFGNRHPNLKDKLYKKLVRWGGNQAGVRLINIDYNGFIKPDPFYEYSAGNIQCDDICEVYMKDPLFVKLKDRKRFLKGRCSSCKYLDICNGGSRTRAYGIYNDYFAEDPSCYINRDNLLK
ncbi:MAG: radical SAM protein [Deltaproteobacteria bacterium]|jgi:radical SAM protein with 4Fe4S-binding SPASM domain|nr:radical SAM protein [Deltaproteobacteria bacterium]